MKILIIGGSGFIGHHLARLLHERRHQVVISSRDPKKAENVLGKNYSYIKWDGATPVQLVPHLENVDAVVNLAGANIGALKRWTKAWKKKLLESRTLPGEALSQAILSSEHKPDVLIQGSAIGYYGIHADATAGEEREKGEGTLAEMTAHWEDSVSSLKDSPTRVVYIRSGMVLGKDSVLLDRLQIPFKFGVGAVLGNGRQWISWIHLRDEINAIRFLIENPKAYGPYNLTAPEPVTMRQMIRTIGRIRKRPVLFNIPAFLLKLVLGEMAEETVLASQDALPEALLDAGYGFEFRNIEEALVNIIKSP